MDTTTTDDGDRAAARGRLHRRDSRVTQAGDGMDAQRFDRLVVALAAAASRRRLLGALAGVLGGALGRRALGGSAAPGAEAVCRSPGRPCDRARQCCTRICKRGRCRCEDGRKPCDGVCCVDVVCCDGVCCGGEFEVCRDRQCVDHCEDGRRNLAFGESDVDCGGDRCPGCEIDQNCFFDTDCRSGVCEDAKCRECRIDDHCGNATAPHCVDLVCVQCRDDDNCGEDVCVDNQCVECRVDADCSDVKECVGNVCRTPASCPVGADLCSQGFGEGTLCGVGCRCYTTTEGETRCLFGGLEPGRCGDVRACTSSATCVSRHGPGAYCVQDTGSSCGCSHCASQCFNG